jgi:hypothetical protein
MRNYTIDNIGRVFFFAFVKMPVIAAFPFLVVSIVAFIYAALSGSEGGMAIFAGTVVMIMLLSFTFSVPPAFVLGMVMISQLARWREAGLSDVDTKKRLVVFGILVAVFLFIIMMINAVRIGEMMDLQDLSFLAYMMIVGGVGGWVFYGTVVNTSKE